MTPLSDAVEVLVLSLVKLEISKEEPGTFAVTVHGFVVRDGLTHAGATLLAQSARATIRGGLQTAIYLLRSGS